MYTTKDLITDFAGFNSWVEQLQEVNEKLFFAPIAPGKWSTAEIISHITFWDQYILDEMLPQMKADADINSIDIETMNKRAAVYAKSGVTKQNLLEAQVHGRKELISALERKQEEDFFATFILNGEKIDEYSGYPHSMFNYFCAFIWHDHHHKEQVDNFLAKEQV